MRSLLYRRLILPALQRVALTVAFASGARPTASSVVRLTGRQAGAARRRSATAQFTTAERACPETAAPAIDRRIA
jgi:hypothetical protein